MPARKPSTVLSHRIARTLAAVAKCDPRTIQRVARGEPVASLDACRVVTSYFDANPGEVPPGWVRPPEFPLRTQVARALAHQTGISEALVQTIARGIPVDEVAQSAIPIIDAYLLEHPEARVSAHKAAS